VQRQPGASHAESCWVWLSFKRVRQGRLSRTNQRHVKEFTLPDLHVSNHLHVQVLGAHRLMCPISER